MKNGFSAGLKWALRLAVGLLACGWVASAHATLCPPCGDKTHTKDLGECRQCGGMTTSGEFALCLACSDRLQACEACRGELAPKAPRLAETPVGRHTFGRWTYEFSISNAGSRSEGYHGVLSYAGQTMVEPPAINDYVATPWGRLYWVGQPVTAFGGHGWMLRPLPSRPIGKQRAPAIPGH